MIFIIYILAFVVVLMGALVVILYRNEERAVQRAALLDNNLKAARNKERELEYKIYKLEMDNEALSVELVNGKEISDIFEEMIDVYKERVKELEKIIDGAGKDCKNPSVSTVDSSL